MSTSGAVYPGSVLRSKFTAINRPTPGSPRHSNFPLRILNALIKFKIHLSPALHFPSKVIHSIIKLLIYPQSHKLCITGHKLFSRVLKLFFRVLKVLTQKHLFFPISSSFLPKTKNINAQVSCLLSLKNPLFPENTSFFFKVTTKSLLDTNIFLAS